MSDAPLVPASAVADKYAVSLQTIYLWRKNGKIQPDSYTKIGNTYRYNLDRIQERFDAQQEEATQEAPTRELIDLTSDEEETYE